MYLGQSKTHIKNFSLYCLQKKIQKLFFQLTPIH